MAFMGFRQHDRARRHVMKLVLMLLLCLALPASAAAQDAMSVLANASKAMGLDNVKTIKYTATGSTYSIGQAYIAGSQYPRNSIRKFVRDFDLDNFLVRQEFVTVRAEELGGALPIAVGS